MIVAFGCKSKKFTVYHIKDKLEEKGWQLRTLQNPPGVHIAITNNNIDNLPLLIKQLEITIEELEKMTDDQISAMKSGPGV